MNYLELTLHVSDDFAEILLAELADLGFDSFIETDDGLQAYIEENLYQDGATKRMLEAYTAKTSIFYSLKKIQKQNWNEQWEKSFDPIEVENKVLVRAHFHEVAESFEHEIIITPKMSFGTGHHDTTYQMMARQLQVNHKDKTVLDAGTGTGILAILAEKLGAAKVLAFDIDEWSVENTIENIQLNTCQKIEVNQGTIKDQNVQSYHIVLANINRNILLDEIPIYTQFMAEGSILILSGFYVQDISEIEAACKAHQLKKITETNKNQWACVVFQL